jgi:hypothetical protein
LQCNCNWDTLSAVAGLTFFNFYLQRYKGSVKSAKVVDFLAALQRRLPGSLLNVRDRLEYLPGYAPDLNPVEYLWAYWRQHSLPNVKDYWSLDDTARRSPTSLLRSG